MDHRSFLLPLLKHIFVFRIKMNQLIYVDEPLFVDWFASHCNQNVLWALNVGEPGPRSISRQLYWLFFQAIETEPLRAASNQKDWVELVFGKPNRTSNLPFQLLLSNVKLLCFFVLCNLKEPKNAICTLGHDVNRCPDVEGLDLLTLIQIACFPHCAAWWINKNCF